MNRIRKNALQFVVGQFMISNALNSCILAIPHL